MEFKAAEQCSPAQQDSGSEDFSVPETWASEKLKAFHRYRFNRRSDSENPEAEALKGQLVGLNWELVDAQMDANRLARMYLELCEMAAPWMGDIQKRRAQATRFSNVRDEASMQRYQLQGTPRIRNENPQRFSKDTVDWDSVYPAPSAGGSVAVHLHLYYTDLADEFIQFFRNIPFPFDLYISCRADASPQAICKQFSVLDLAQSITVRKTQNRGRDLAPLYVLFRKEIATHDFFLHVHSKKSLYTGSEQSEWRTGALRALCGSDMTIRRVFGILQSSRNIGLLYPETIETMPVFTHSWLQSGHMAGKLAGELGFSGGGDIFNYPVGSFFWARTEAVRPLFDRAYTYDDFDEEQGQNDGTLAHGLERAIALLTKSRGYAMAIIDPEDKVVRFDSSHKLLRSYFKQTLSDAKALLSGYDAVSFDIFDTLITRKLYAPDDLFYLMADLFEKRFGYRVDYIKYRKEAEAKAWKKHGAETNIHHIYAELPQLLDLSEQDAAELKKLEIDLEYECCIPRRDMLELYRYLRRLRVPIYLVSDMYLPEDVVAELLKRCGYTDYDRLFLSCELGLRKDDGTMWTYLKQIWNGRRVIHVGDNLCSDMQYPCDLGMAFYPVLNPRTLLQLTPMYETFAPHVRPQIGTSYALGIQINACLFNSPFALADADQLRPLDYSAAAKAMFGSTLLSLVQAIPNHAAPGQQLLFLAREGYFLLQLYKAYVKASGRPLNPSCYFLASRRATAVAAIRSEDDIRNTLMDYYRGTLGNLLQTRLGLRMPPDVVELPVHMPEQLEDVLSLLTPNMGRILRQSAQERQAYRRYAASLLLETGTPPLVIDLGYSGTIQYNLSLLLGTRIDGFYLLTEARKKPTRLGCACESLFSRNTDRCEGAIMDNSLYLESILQAPYGQFVCFSENEGAEADVVPHYRNDALPPNEIFTMQQAILEYALELAAFEKKIGLTVELNPDAAANSFVALAESKTLPSGIVACFSVEDFYCGNGVKQVNTKTGKWH